MKYFVGTYENKIDSKGRVSLPSAFRDVLRINNSNNFYLFPSPTQDSLEAGGEDLIDFIAKSIEQNAPMFSQDEETYNYILANARPCSFDSTGRFVLPEEFSQFASLSGNALFVGNGKRFQIWQPLAYHNATNGRREQFASRGLTIKNPDGGNDD
ncbi:MAG: division/cell wall cluster transcriptional repressor MraZ [Alphaproteobacteria bacterium]